MAEVFDDRVCKLGEGPLWHPEREQLFWFDILGKKLLSRTQDTPQEWPWDEHVSAAGWTGYDTLLIASETGLWHFNVETWSKDLITPLEADNPVTRSNDGRADPWGGFWIGTMGKAAEAAAGAIYRFHKGELRKITEGITISNAICFAPDKSHAYFTDTVTARIMQIPLNPDTGWPDGPAHCHIDMREERLNPDGAVTDAEGDLWVAEWDSARISHYDTAGKRVAQIGAPALQTSCPAFGGPEFRDLYITSATIGLPNDEFVQRPHSGMTFVVRSAGRGRPEPKVIL